MRKSIPDYRPITPVMQLWTMNASLQRAYLRIELEVSTAAALNVFRILAPEWPSTAEQGGIPVAAEESIPGPDPK